MDICYRSYYRREKHEFPCKKSHLASHYSTLSAESGRKCTWNWFSLLSWFSLCGWSIVFWLRGYWSFWIQVIFSEMNPFEVYDRSSVIRTLRIAHSNDVAMATSGHWKRHISIITKYNLEEMLEKKNMGKKQTLQRVKNSCSLQLAGFLN